MSWTAVLPFRGGEERKTRLAGHMSATERRALSDHMLQHAARVLHGIPAIERLVLLSGSAPDYWQGDVVTDEGRGLNAEIAAFADTIESGGLVVLLPDLPLLTRDDIEAVLTAAKDGCAIGPDRHGTGTNALALCEPSGFAFGFGVGSFARHQAAAPDAAIVRRAGLGLDCDEPDDLAAAAELGFKP